MSDIRWDDAYPMVTGFFVAKMHEGHWGRVDIVHLSDEELDEFFARQTPENTTRWAIALVKWIRDRAVPINDTVIAKALEILSQEGNRSE